MDPAEVRRRNLATFRFLTTKTGSGMTAERTKQVWTLRFQLATIKVYEVSKSCGALVATNNS